jgi:Na+/glutamate symporter
MKGHVGFNRPATAVTGRITGILTPDYAELFAVVVKFDCQLEKVFLMAWFSCPKYIKN